MSRDLAAIITICFLGASIMALVVFKADISKDLLTLIIAFEGTIVTGLFAIIKNIPRTSTKEKLKQSGE